MKLFITILLICSSFLLKSQDYIHEFVCTDSSTISYLELPSGILNGRANRVSKVICEYFKSIEENNYDQWYSLLSDSTKKNIIPVKFPNKFKRLVGYNIHDWKVKEVIEFEEVYGNNYREQGRFYNLILKLPEGVNIENRVSFDPLKNRKMKEKEQFIGINIAEVNDKVYKIFLYKYAQNAKGTNHNNK